MTRERALELAKHYQSADHYDFWQYIIKTLEQEPKYRMAYEYSDGTVHKFVWDNGWKEVEQEPCDNDCEHCTWTECPIEPCEDAISRERGKNEVN